MHWRTDTDSAGELLNHLQMIEECSTLETHIINIGTLASVFHSWHSYIINIGAMASGNLSIHASSVKQSHCKENRKYHSWNCWKRRNFYFPNLIGSNSNSTSVSGDWGSEEQVPESWRWEFCGEAGQYLWEDDRAGHIFLIVTVLVLVISLVVKLDNIYEKMIAQVGKLSLI